MTNGSKPPPEAVEAARAARDQLAELTGRTAESVSALLPVEDGWVAHVEVLELRRIPDSTSLLATHEVRLDRGGGLTGYRRLRRYARGSSDRRDPPGAPPSAEPPETAGAPATADAPTTDSEEA